MFAQPRLPLPGCRRQRRPLAPTCVRSDVARSPRPACLSQLNIANPSTGGQKLIEIEDDKKLRILYEKRLAAEVDGIDLGDEFKGYVFKILGGQDKQGFSMHQGVLTTDRVRLMMAKGARLAQPLYCTRSAGDGYADGEKKRGGLAALLDDVTGLPEE